MLSAALDAGTAVGVILVYFWCVTLFPPIHGFSPNCCIAYNTHLKARLAKVQYKPGGVIWCTKIPPIGTMVPFETSLTEPLGVSFNSDIVLKDS